MEQEPDPFAAEQTYLTNDDIKGAQRQRKDSYDQMDQDMAGNTGANMANQLNQDALNGAFEKLKGQENDDLQGMFD